MTQIDSDHETRRLLTRLFEREEDAPDRLVVLLEEVPRMDSDHTKARLLRSVSHLSSHEDVDVR